MLGSSGRKRERARAGRHARGDYFQAPATQAKTGPKRNILQRLPLTRAREWFFLSVETSVFVNVNQLCRQEPIKFDGLLVPMVFSRALTEKVPCSLIEHEGRRLTRIVSNDNLSPLKRPLYVLGGLGRKKTSVLRALSIFRLLLFLWGYPAGASAEERGFEGRQRF